MCENTVVLGLVIETGPISQDICDEKDLNINCIETLLDAETLQDCILYNTDVTQLLTLMLSKSTSELMSPKHISTAP